MHAGRVRRRLLAIGLTGPFAARAAADAPQGPITVEQVDAAQQGWCDGLLDIAKTHAAGGDYKAVALGVLSNVYNYDHGPVLFKPTLTHGDQTFRLDR